VKGLSHNRREKRRKRGRYLGILRDCLTTRREGHLVVEKDGEKNRTISERAETTVGTTRRERGRDHPFIVSRRRTKPEKNLLNVLPSAVIACVRGAF